jgi:hypothetical protein
MKLNNRETLLLRAIVKTPCSLHDFTAGTNTTISPHIISIYLDRQVEAGLITRPTTANGKYHPTAAGVAHVAALEPVETRTPFAERPPYVPPKWTSTRAGAENHLLIKSRTSFVDQQ